MDLKRDIYKDLKLWKTRNSGKVLEVSGARQVGKTYILTKFVKENYKRFFYINMMQTSGQEFLSCLDKAARWEPGEKRIEHPIHEALELFCRDFTDDEDMVVLIDEIQDSARVYSLIRQFAREFKAHFIVTGSYLGKTLDKEYFLPAGDIETMILDTLSYEEFLQAAGKRDLYEKVDLYGSSSHGEYDELRDLYDIYCRIGGYPAVVRRYFETRDLDECRYEISQIIRIFVEESERYFDDILEMNLLEQVLPGIARTMLKEKKGSPDLVKELSSVLFRDDSNRITKKSVNQAIAWFYRSNVIGYCGQVNEGNLLDVTPNCRFYFRDLGVADYFLNMVGAPPDMAAGIVNENFVYLYLKRKIDSREIAGLTPLFALYKGGELDFFVNSRKDYKNYGIEVKAGHTIGKTANRMLEDGKIQALYLLKGDTYGGVEGKKVTIPVYLAGRMEFDNF